MMGEGEVRQEIQDTIGYYEQNAEQFAEGTVSVDFTEIQNRFLDKLGNRARILDFGCGSGRDTKYFLEQGCQVEAIDGSAELCRLACAYTGIEVKQMLFQDLDAVGKYDGIWACSSILHLPPDELRDVLGKMKKALKDRGIIYMSFKYGTFVGERNGRFFTDMTEETLAELVRETGGLVTEEQWITADVRPGRDEERWINIMLRKE